MLDSKEEKKFAELREKCRELKVMAPPEIFIGLKVHDKNGVLVFDDIQRGHSWTRNFYNMAFSMMADVGGDGGSTFGAGYFTAKNVDGIVRGANTYTAFKTSGILLGYGFHNNAASATFGIVIGTGDTAFSVDQYGLATLIAHGSGAGQMSYNAMVAPVQAYTAGSKTWKNTVSRIFNNNSGSSIIVKETGLYTNHYVFNDANYWMTERSVLSPAVSVANAGQLTVTYEFSMDFSAID